MLVLPLVPAWVETTQVMAFLDTEATRPLITRLAGTLQKEITPRKVKIPFTWKRGQSYA